MGVIKLLMSNDEVLKAHVLDASSQMFQFRFAFHRYKVRFYLFLKDFIYS